MSNKDILDQSDKIFLSDYSGKGIVVVDGHDYERRCRERHREDFLILSRELGDLDMVSCQPLLNEVQKNELLTMLRDQLREEEYKSFVYCI